MEGWTIVIVSSHVVKAATYAMQNGRWLLQQRSTYWNLLCDDIYSGHSCLVLVFFSYHLVIHPFISDLTEILKAPSLISAPLWQIMASLANKKAHKHNLIETHSLQSEAWISIWYFFDPPLHLWEQNKSGWWFQPHLFILGKILNVQNHQPEMLKSVCTRPPEVWCLVC